MANVTINDIAKLANVSKASVSFAINNRPGISEETRKRILKVIEDTGYLYPLSKANNTRSNIAILFRNNISALDRQFYTELNTNIIQECEQLPYNFIIASTHYKDDKLIFSDILRSPDLDVIITYGDVDKEILPELKKLEVPMLVLDCSRKEVTKNAVHVDYTEAAYTATKYLIDIGHSDIAYIGNEQQNEFDVLTFSGFQNATTEFGLTLSMNRIQISVHNEDSLYKCIDHALSGEKYPTALFCTTDSYAIHAIKYLHSKGINVPNDISVIGIDDINVSRFLIPALTTVRVNIQTIGKMGIELLKRILNGEECDSVTIPHCELIIRESTAPPRK